MNLRWIVLGIACACGGKSGSGPDAGGVCDPPCPTGSYCSTANECISDGTCLTDADCPQDEKCNPATQTCVGGCGGEVLDLTYVPPNFLVVLDRSCSMDKGTPTKWQSAVGALDHMLTTHETDIRWGLTLFPDTTNETCTQDAIPFPVGPANAPPIKSMLAAALAPADPLFPDGPCVTNIDTAILQAATDPGLADPARDSYLMLVTDGAQAGCSTGGGDAGTVAAIRDLHDTRGVTTFVVGFGAGVDAAQLNEFAVAGGAPRAGATKYYRADNAAQLDMVFQAIAGAVVSCEYLVDPAPADVAQTYVFFNNTELVPRDPTHVMGWDYDPATMKITLYGSYCTRLQTHQVTDLDVVFGCPVPPVL